MLRMNDSVVFKGSWKQHAVFSLSSKPEFSINETWSNEQKPQEKPSSGLPRTGH